MIKNFCNFDNIKTSENLAILYNQELLHEKLV